MLYIGVDLGTSSVKLVLMDETGKIHGTTSREYKLYFPQPGWSEQEPADWYNEAIAGLKDLLKDVDKSEVAGISFVGINCRADKRSDKDGDSVMITIL